MKINDVIKLDEKISDDDKARIRKAMGPNKDANVKPLIKLTPGWGDKGRSMKAGYGKIAKSPEEMDEGWKDLWHGGRAEKKADQANRDAYFAYKLEKVTKKFEKDGLSPEDARKYAYRKVYGAPQTEAKQKPYVSSDSDGKHVMTASGKVAKTFKDMDSANAYLKKHYDDLLNEGPIDAIKNIGAGIAGAFSGKGYDAGVAGRDFEKIAKPVAAKVYKQWVAQWQNDPEMQSKDTPPEKKDAQLRAFIDRFRTNTPKEKWDAMAGQIKGMGADVRAAQKYIDKLVRLEMSATKAPEGGEKQGGGEEKSAPGMQATQNTDATKVAKGTIFSIKQSGGGEAMYRWDGGTWSKLSNTGKWQSGQIKNDLAFKLYLAAVKQGTAMSPIPGDPNAGAAYVDPNTGKKVDPDAPATPAPAGQAQAGQAQAGQAQAQGDAQAGSTTPQVDANKDGKDDNTGEPIKQTDANKDGKDDTTGEPMKQVDANKDGKDDNTGEPMKPADDAQAQGDAQAQAGAVDPKRLEGAKTSISTANKASIDALARLLKIEKAT